jgi:hypothetical protein
LSIGAKERVSSHVLHPHEQDFFNLRSWVVSFISFFNP